MGKDWDRLGGARIRQPSERDRTPGVAHNGTTSLVTRNQPDAYVAGSRMQAWHEAWSREALRVLKPGGHLLAFGGTRTYHRLACAVEDAGFEIRDEVLSIFEATDAGRQFLASLAPEQIAALDRLGGGPLAWVYGSGFPKSLSVEKATRKLLEERYGEQACSCVDGGVGRAAGDDPGLASCGDDRGGRGACAVSTHPVGNTELPLDGSGVSDDRVRELRGADQAPPAGREAVETAVLRSGVRGRGAEATRLRGAEVRARVEGHEGDDPREGQDVSGVRQDAAGERPRAARPPSQAVPAGRDESSDESGGAVRPLPSRSGGCDIGCVRLDPARREPRRLVLDDHAGRQRAMARVCSWCGFPAREWLDELAPLGSALKPAHEPIVVARKPLVGTVAANVLEHGTGAMNVDGCRVVATDVPDEADQAPNAGARYRGVLNGGKPSDPEPRATSATSAGRWPANVVLSHAEGCVLVDRRPVRSNGHFPAAMGSIGYGGSKRRDGLEERRFDGELAEVWACVPGCPVRMLDDQSGVSMSSGRRGGTPESTGIYGGSFPRGDGRDVGFGDAGGASRFFLTTQRHKIEGCEPALIAEQSSGHVDARRASAQNDVAVAASREATASSGCREPITTETPLRSNESGGSDMQRIQSFASALSLARRQGALSPNANHVNSAETREPTGITTTTASRSRSDGSADAAISEDTLLNVAVGALGLRFRYCAKASRAEREAGLPEGLEARHPTVKPIELMRWLVRLVTPPGGLVLDPFCGSGSTGCAAVLEGFRFVGVECDREYVAIARARIEFWAAHSTELPVEVALAADAARRRVREGGQLGLL